MTAPLDSHLGYWLRHVSNHVSQGFARALADQGVQVVEWVALRLLLQDGMAPARLAGAMGVTRGAVTKLADRLILRGLVLRADDPTDGRAQILRLTDAGAALVPRLAALADANDAAFFGHLAPQDQARLRDLLTGLARHHGLTGTATE